MKRRLIRIALIASMLTVMLGATAADALIRCHLTEVHVSTFSICI